jgi:aspartate racemase
VHFFIGELRKEVSIPVISIIDETIEKIKKENLRKVGILATSKTIELGLYRKPIECKNIDILEPDKKRISNVIFEIIHNKNIDENRSYLEKTISKMKADGAEAVILACTDLQLLLDKKRSPVKIIDTLEVLAESTVRYIIEKQKINKGAYYG